MGRVSITLELLNRTAPAAVSKDDDALANEAWVSASRAIALLLGRTNGNAQAEVESSADEVEFAPIVSRGKRDANA